MAVPHGESERQKLRKRKNDRKSNPKPKGTAATAKPFASGYRVTFCFGENPETQGPTPSSNDRRSLTHCRETPQWALDQSARLVTAFCGMALTQSGLAVPQYLVLLAPARSSLLGCLAPSQTRRRTLWSGRGEKAPPPTQGAHLFSQVGHVAAKMLGPW